MWSCSNHDILPTQMERTHDQCVIVEVWLVLCAIYRRANTIWPAVSQLVLSRPAACARSLPDWDGCGHLGLHFERDAFLWFRPLTSPIVIIVIRFLDLFPSHVEES